MHAMGGVIDMRRFSGLRAVLPQTHLAFAVGALALSGFPLLSGFWSKDEILAAAFEMGTHGPDALKTTYFILFLVGLITAFLTAFYTFRAYFMTFWGELRVPPEAGSHGGHDEEETHASQGHGHDAHHGHLAVHSHAPAPTHGHGEGKAHESPPVMTMPLMILAVFAFGVGLVLGPTHLFAHFLEATPGFPSAAGHSMNLILMTLSSLVAIGGIGLAYYFYVAQPALPGQIARAVPALYQLSFNKFYFDELYVALIVNPLIWMYHAIRNIDVFLVDGLVDLFGRVPSLVGSVFRPVQNGLVQFYALAMVLGIAVFLLALVRGL